jgi:hypothetical protein
MPQRPCLPACAPRRPDEGGRGRARKRSRSRFRASKPAAELRAPRWWRRPARCANVPSCRAARSPPNDPARTPARKPRAASARVHARRARGARGGPLAPSPARDPRGAIRTRDGRGSPRAPRTLEAVTCLAMNDRARHPAAWARERRRRRRSAILRVLLVVACLVSVWAMARALMEGDLRAMPAAPSP